MKTDQILYLKEIERCGSMKKAGESLFLSHQALSISVRKLEAEVGFPIIQRSAHGVSLTKKGRELLQAGQHFLATIEDIRGSAPAFREPEQKITAAYGILDVMLPYAITSLYKKFPGISIDITRVTFGELMQEFSENKEASSPAFVTLPYVGGQSLFSLDGLRIEFLTEGKYVALIPNSIPLHSFKQCSLNAVTKYPVIIHKPTADYLLRILHLACEEPVIRYVDTIPLYGSMLENGVGVGFTTTFPPSGTPLFLPGNTTPVTLHEDISMKVAYVCPETHVFTEDELLMLDQVKQALSDLPSASFRI